MMTGEKMVCLRRFASEVEAEAAASALGAAGITVNVVGGLLAGFRAECPSEVEVFVNAPDVARAEAILQETIDQPVDWDKVDVGQPDD